MTDRIERLRRFFIVDKAHHAVRRPPLAEDCLAADFAQRKLPDTERAVERLCFMLRQEEPHLFPEERIAFVRTLPNVPELFTEEELEALRRSHWIHERGDVSNINVDYRLLLDCGLAERMAQLRRQRQEHPEAADYITGQLRILQCVEELAERYRRLAERQGNTVVARTLARVPRYAPRTFLEALQMFRILHFTMWLGGNYHNTLGRLDQYLYPYFLHDRDTMTEEQLLEQLEEFFLTFNRDSDLYPGMQQGDNGQSLVLGGRSMDGTDSYNQLSELCLRASLELRLIDPKINLRVHRDTPQSVYVLGTRLTKQGLGFPQYANDDVVIPGLLDLGYAPEDAYNYAVAACWEFIIPGKAMDIPNIAALSFARAANDAIRRHLMDSPDFSTLCRYVAQNINAQVEELCRMTRNTYLFPAPFLSLMMDNGGCVGRDISQGAVYNNYGFHGTGLATAADSLAAVKCLVYDQGEPGAAERLLRALEDNFRKDESLRSRLRYEMPKMGNDDDTADSLAVWLLDTFADAVQGRRNDRGGVYRAGTGSAMYYLWHGTELSATADGRQAEEALPCNYSPSLFARCRGPVSLLKSFAKPHLRRVINGGPLTLELHDTLFRTEESVEKVALLVRSFMEMGGHQLQLNAVNRDTLLDAQRHPEQYRNLIVRVWGWSGYFVELDRAYQDHIIQRMELQI